MKKVALVTGASRGIGKAIATGLIEEGTYVIGTSTSTTGATKLKEDFGGNGAGLRLDISDSNSISECFSEIKERFEPPAILVNNAGITRDNISLRMKDREWEEVIGTNLTGLHKVTKTCLKDMIKARWGRIVNISSVVGAMGNAGQSNYAAAKSGIEGYSRSLATELSSRGITVNCIAPGFIRTDMTDNIEAGAKDRMLAAIPAGRLGEPAEVAALTVFLCGDSASYITGETIHINGGLYMR